MAGYVARKFKRKCSCARCATKLATRKQNVVYSEHNQLIKGRFVASWGWLSRTCNDIGGCSLLFFLLRSGRHFSIHDLMVFLSTVKLHQVNHENHCEALTAKKFSFLCWHTCTFTPSHATNLELYRGKNSREGARRSRQVQFRLDLGKSAITDELKPYSPCYPWLGPSKKSEHIFFVLCSLWP